MSVDRTPEDWELRLETIVETMRELSLQTDPQEMVRKYVARMQQMLPGTRRISLSRRDLEPPECRVTRYSEWADEINPWKEPERLPLLRGGLFAELIYANRPRVIHELEFDPDDPAGLFLDGQRSLMAIPLFDEGVSLNMVVVTSQVAHAFQVEELPERVWLANLFGRATQNLVLAERLEAAYQQVDRELKVVADIQRSLLPRQLPQIPGWEVATWYQTSRQAGGDYYDFFPLPNGQWGVLIADVSGHGTPAAVMMAVTHCIAHMYPGSPMPPQALLQFLNHHLSTRYTAKSGHFVTAFYAIYDPERRSLTYSSAGQNPPRLRRRGDDRIQSLDQAGGFPLGIFADAQYSAATLQLQQGDRIVMYTDGIVEAADGEGDLFGVERLDDVIADCHQVPEESVRSVMDRVDAFKRGRPPSDDRTLIILDVK